MHCNLSTSLCSLALVLLATAPAGAQDAPGEVLDQQKISDSNGGFDGEIPDFYEFGHSLAAIGDLDGDGVTDLAVGSREWTDLGYAVGDFDGSGAVWILFMDTDGTVRDEVKIARDTGGFDGELDAFDFFGTSIAFLGDVDGDGIGDLAVGAAGDDDGANRAGAVWILFMNTDGTVDGHAKISNTSGGWPDPLGNSNEFGRAVAGLGDFDDDGVPDLVVTAPRRFNVGSFWIVTLNADGSVKGTQATAGDSPDFGAYRLGVAITSLGDFDGDGTGDVALLSSNGVWVTLLHPDGTVEQTTKLGAETFGFAPELFFVFGGPEGYRGGLASFGDLDGDGIGDIAVGIPYMGVGGIEQVGSVEILMLNADGTARQRQSIRNNTGNFGGTVSQNGHFGWSLASLGDLDGDGVKDLAVGERRGDDGGPNRGHVWTLFLEAAIWTDLGNDLPGTPGAPELRGLGTLQRGDPVNIALAEALPGTLAFLIVGFAELDAPFKGGVLVPDPAPPGALFALPTGSGEIVIDDSWPPGVPPDFTTIFQYWIQDPGAVAGFSASNALAATTP